MNISKKYFLFFAGFFLTGNVSAFAFFDDISGIPAEKAITELAEANVISTKNADGSPRLQYHPNNSINRVEFLKFAFEAFELGEAVQKSSSSIGEMKNIFSDTDPSGWYFPYVAYAKAEGVIQGYANGEFRPANSITRAEAIKLLLLISKIKTSTDTKVHFSDVPASSWVFDFIDRAESLCIFDKTDMLFPNDALTRADMAIFVQRIRTIFFGGELCDDKNDISEEKAPEEKTKKSEGKTLLFDGDTSDDQDSEKEEKTIESDIPLDWKRYPRDKLGYSFSIPKDWFWSEQTGKNDVVFVLEIGTESEISDENRTATIEIARGKDFDKGESETKNIFSTAFQRDETTYFRIFGDTEYKKEIRGIAGSIIFGEKAIKEEEGEDDDTESIPKKAAVIRLSEESPKAMKVPLNANNVPFLTFVIRAPKSEDVKIVTIAVTRKGLGNPEEIEAVKIFDGFTHYGAKEHISDETQKAIINLVHDPIFIEAGTEKVITVTVDLDAKTSGGQHIFSINSLDDITVMGVESGEEIPVSGSFPIGGEKMGVSDIKVGNISFKFDSPESAIRVGVLNQELAQIILSEKEGVENILLHTITLSFDGVSDGELQDIFIDFRGERISNKVGRVKNGKATFYFIGEYEKGFPINKSREKTIRVKGDVLGGGGEALNVFIDDFSTDVLATGELSGF